MRFSTLAAVPTSARSLQSPWDHEQDCPHAAYAQLTSANPYRLPFDCRMEDAPHCLAPLYQVWEEEKGCKTARSPSMKIETRLNVVNTNAWNPIFHNSFRTGTSARSRCSSRR